MHIIFPTAANPAGLAVTSFYGDGWSNFRAVGEGGAKWRLEEEPMDFKCGEQVFKAAAVVSQMDPADDTSFKAALLHTVLQNVMTAKAPKECKRAVFEIPNTVFDSSMWDAGAAEYVMYETQKWKCMAPSFHAMMKRAGKEAEYYGVERLYFVEAAGTDDLRWGCGLTVDEFHASIVANVESPDWLSMKSESPYSGKNLLGEALTHASKVVLGENFEYLKETVEEYVARIGVVCPLFVLAPQVVEDKEGVASTIVQQAPDDTAALEETVGVLSTADQQMVGDVVTSTAMSTDVQQALGETVVQEVVSTTLEEGELKEVSCGRTLSMDEDQDCRTVSFVEEKSPKRRRDEDSDV